MKGKIGKDKQKQKEIQHVIVSLLESGLSIFHHSFVNEKIDPDLFSALITATSMQQKFSSTSTDRVLQEQFQIERYTANVCHGEYLAGIVVTSSTVNPEILNRFLKFLALFEEEYKFLIRNWHGDRTFFDQEWALDQLTENLFAPTSGYRLVEGAMQHAANARQIRLILLIQRHEQGSSFSREQLVQLFEKELQIPISSAEVYFADLKKGGVVVDA